MYQRHCKPWLTGRYIRVWPHLSEDSIVWSYFCLLCHFFALAFFVFLLDCLAVPRGIFFVSIYCQFMYPVRQLLCVFALGKCRVCIHMEIWRESTTNALSLSQQEICFYHDIFLYQSLGYIYGIMILLSFWICIVHEQTLPCKIRAQV